MLIVVVIDTKTQEEFIEQYRNNVIEPFDILIFVCEKYNDSEAFMKYYKTTAYLGKTIALHFMCMECELTRLFARETWLYSHVALFDLRALPLALTDELYKKQNYNVKVDVYHDFSFLFL